MLTHAQICEAVNDAAKQYPIKAAYYFGSYANGTQREDSDLDLRVELSRPLTMFTLADLYTELEDKLKRPVDILTVPKSQLMYLIIEREVKCYG